MSEQLGPRNEDLGGLKNCVPLHSLSNCDNSFFQFSFLFILCKSFVPECMCVHQMRALCPQKSEEDVRSGTGIMVACKSPCGCLKLNLGPLST